MHRHGERRYRCPSCGKTQRSRWKKRGRKYEPGAPADVTEFFLRGKVSVRDVAHFRNVSYGTAHEWIRRGAKKVLKESSPQVFKWNNSSVILILDALWLKSMGEQWTIYCVLARHVGEKEARIAICMARPGHESYAGWRATIGRLFPTMRRSVIGVTSDGHAGLERAVKELCPNAIQQRCQFHVFHYKYFKAW